MLSLCSLQSRFATALFEDEPGAITPWIRGDGIDPAARLEVYRNNLREGFRRTVALEYPVIRRLVGEDCFRQLVLAFLTGHPSASGDLHHVGAPFAPFLRSHFADTSYRYLADVAALEWAYQECLVADDGDVLDPTTLRDVPAQSYATLRFTLRPDCRLVHSLFPVLKIWEVNQPEARDDATVRLDSGPDFLLVLRNSKGVYFHRIGEDDHRLLAAFDSGKSLEEALEISLASNPHFDLSAALRRCIESGALSRVTFYHTILRRSLPCHSG